MGFVGRSPSPATLYLPLASYAALVCFTVSRHEPWADEAQAWLIARDSSLPAIWSRLLHLEGTPGLWHSLLWCLTRLRVPYQALGYLAASLGTVGAFLVLRYSPFPLVFRVLLPFTYFLAYQYSVVARSYVLIPPLLFGLAAASRSPGRRPYLSAVLLAALALTSMHGLLFAWAFVLCNRDWRLLPVLFLASLASLAAAWPAPDVTFVQHLSFSGAHLALTATRALAEAFTTEWISALLLVSLTVPFLAKGRSLLFFLASATGLIVLSAVVYGQVWHFGLLSVAWFTALWLAADRTPPGRAVALAFSVALLIQCFWTAAAVSREATTAYSAGASTARYLKTERIPEAGLYGVGYACVAVQPYFSRNVFLNFGFSYWDWSSQNHMIARYEQLAQSRPAWVLVGYKTNAENYLWNSLVRRSGYRKMRHFEGNLIWEDEPFEPESFDLYQRQ